ncbi:DUF4249 domain-containing protein [Maribacter algicola]|nr:DUF4249 domain-containing protein [Maribacter algicola]
MACIDDFEIENITDVLEGYLVVDARITDWNGKQTIFLSRTFALEDSEPSPEKGALVAIIDEMGGRIGFQEIAPGNYTNEGNLSLKSSSIYKLEIITRDGVRYMSEEVRLPNKVPIVDLRAEGRLNGFSSDGLAILLDNGGIPDQSGYFRFEFEETYQIVAPYPNPFDWDEIDYDINDGDGWEVTIAGRTEPVNICYGNSASRDIILSSTEDLLSGGLDDFVVRFIAKDNPIISHRYSILVKQYHHDINARAFFETLNSFSSLESIFSNVQTGRLEGNIQVQNSDVTLVFGYFELSSYSEKRLFLNYRDFFPDEELPPYFMNCATGAPALYPRGFHLTPAEGGGFVIDGTNSSPLIEGILAGLYAYHADNDDFENLLSEGSPLGGLAPFLVKPLGCVDCGTFGSYEKPDFWID